MKCKHMECHQCEDETTAALREENEELKAMLGKGPYVPLHQYEEVCKRRDALKRRVERLEKAKPTQRQISSDTPRRAPAPKEDASNE